MNKGEGRDPFLWLWKSYVGRMEWWQWGWILVKSICLIVLVYTPSVTEFLRHVSPIFIGDAFVFFMPKWMVCWGGMSSFLVFYSWLLFNTFFCTYIGSNTVNFNNFYSEIMTVNLVFLNCRKNIVASVTAFVIYIWVQTQWILLFVCYCVCHIYTPYR